MFWFADNSEMYWNSKLNIPNVFIFGGILIEGHALQKLRQNIETVKYEQCGDKYAPIKWNFKDLKQTYKERGKESTYANLLNSSEDWREKCFEILKSSKDVCVVTACIAAYGKNRDSILRNRRKLARFVFSNALMQVALCVRSANSRYASAVIDWPEQGHRKIFDEEYAAAFSEGTDASGNVTYYSGPLNKLGFADTVYYASGLHSCMLQVADLIVGTTKELIEVCLGLKTEDCHGLQSAREIGHQYFGSPNGIVGKGISVPKGNQILKKSLEMKVPELPFDPGETS